MEDSYSTHRHFLKGLGLVSGAFATGFFAVNNSTTIAEGEEYNSPSGIPPCHSVFCFSTPDRVTVNGQTRYFAYAVADCRHSGMFYKTMEKDLGNKFESEGLAMDAINKYVNELRVDMERLCKSCKS